jgi:hypothetical protein
VFSIDWAGEDMIGSFATGIAWALAGGTRGFWRVLALRQMRMVEYCDWKRGVAARSFSLKGG